MEKAKQNEETFEIELQIKDGKIEFHPNSKGIVSGNNLIVKDLTIENIKRISFIMDSETSKISVTVINLGEQ